MTMIPLRNADWPTALMARSRVPLALALAVIALWIVSALFLDAGLAASLPSRLTEAAQMLNILFHPVLWFVLAAMWLLVARWEVGPFAHQRVLATHVLAVWAASTLIIESLAIVVGHYQPRLLLTGTETMPLFGATPQSVWGFLAAALWAMPRARPVILTLGMVAAGLKIASAEAYLSDVVVSCLLCLGVGKLMLEIFPSHLPGPALETDIKSE